MKELQKSKSVTLFFLPEFCQKMEKMGERGGNSGSDWVNFLLKMPAVIPYKIGITKLLFKFYILFQSLIAEPIREDFF
jgi:hypothetical protein